MLLSFLLTYTGCTALCLSMYRHFQHVFPERKANKKMLLILRTLGWILIAIAGAYCVTIESTAIAIVCLCGLITAATFLLIMLLSYAPRLTIPLAITMLFLSVIIYAL